MARKFTIEPLEERLAPSAFSMKMCRCGGKSHHGHGGHGGGGQFQFQGQFQSQFQSQHQSMSLSVTISVTSSGGVSAIA